MSAIIPSAHDLAVENANAAYAKTQKTPFRQFLLAIGGGLAIAIGFTFYVTSQQGALALPAGPMKVLGGVCFSTGIILVVVLGLDLFTSTTMTVLPLYEKKIRLPLFLRHWTLSVTGNLVGALGLAVALFFAHQHMSSSGSWGEVALRTAATKASHGPLETLILAILANIAVCAAVWMAQSGRSTVDKIFACVFPISFFVASSFEHSIANMFLLPMGLLTKYYGGAEFWNSQAVLESGKTFADYAAFTPMAAVQNIVIVLIGNIIGGGFMLATFFYFTYIKNDVKKVKKVHGE
ncbi:formate/nitrite transporter family protein [Actinotignum urinale]|uniref:formate/nitrite transporter family protein n=1 Tax=Actinotignum urinale TaxID=190146 RepID=UPI0003B64103|nr:formate/nitrite transporter family protein [Actinotignum urinale]MDY5160751.1 formate/nitrite transporter family protein [Actinotignum urinale]